MQSDRGGRNDLLDWLRTVAILIVLVVHAVPGYEKTNLEKFGVDWLTTVFRPCIAIFLFSAGFFFPIDADF